MIYLFLTAIIILVTVWYYRKKNTSGLELPPGPRGLPIIGSLLSMDPVNPHKSFIKLANQYSKNGIFSVQLGALYTVVLTDPYLMKEAFNKEVFTARPALYLTHGIMKGKGIICAQGDLWKDQRKLLSTWMRILGAGRGSLSRPHLAARLSASADQLEQQILKNLQSVDIFHCMKGVIGNTINELTYGITFPEDDPVWKWSLDIQESGVKEMGVAGVLNFLPFLRFFSSKLRKTMNGIVDGQTQQHKLINSIIKIRRKFLAQKNGLKVEEQPDDDEEIECKTFSLYSDEIEVCYFKPSTLNISKDDCVIDYYLEEQEKRKLEGDTVGLERLSDDQLRFFMCDIFGAALDTSLNTLGWFMLMMAMHKNEQELVRKELHSIYGENPPTLERMQELTYTRAAICETQRIRSVVPVGLPHGALQDTSLAGYFIPKGTMILPFQWYVHNDETVWKNPEEFNPSRFIGANGNLLNPPHFIPFQSGKRMCPGDEFAKMMMFMFGSRIVSRYEMSLENPIPSSDGIFGLTLNPPEYKLTLKPIF